jgi:acetyl esterase
MVLLYPVVDNGPRGYGNASIKARYQKISPMHNVSAATPPTLFFLGTADRLIPVETAEEVKARLNKAGVRCDIQLVEDPGHPIYEYSKGDTPARQQILSTTDTFFSSLGL